MPDFKPTFLVVPCASWLSAGLVYAANATNESVEAPTTQIALVALGSLGAMSTTALVVLVLVGVFRASISKRRNDLKVQQSASA